MLKYFIILFFLFTVLSIPTFMFYSSNSIVNPESGDMSWMHYLSLGSISAKKTVATAKFDLDTKTKVTSMMLVCPEKSLHTNLVYFGLADQNSRVIGDGLN